MATPSEILKKAKSTEKKKEPDADDKKPERKGSDAMLDFISKYKKKG